MLIDGHHLRLQFRSCAVVTGIEVSGYRYGTGTGKMFVSFTTRKVGKLKILGTLHGNDTELCIIFVKRRRGGSSIRVEQIKDVENSDNYYVGVFFLYCTDVLCTMLQIWKS